MASITEQYQKIYEQALEAQKKYNNNIKNKKTTTSSKKNNASKNKSNSNTQNKVASNQSNKNDSSSNPYNVSVAQPDYTKFIGKNKTSLYQNSTNSKNNPYQLKVAQPDYTKFKSQIDTIVEKGKKALAEREKAFNDWYTEDKKDMLFNADGSYRDLRSELNEFESKIKTKKADNAYSVYKNKQYKKELEKAIEFSDYLQMRDKEKTLSSEQEKIDFYTMQDAYNDTFLEKSAKKIGKVGANILNMPFQAADIVNDFLDPNFDINNPHNLSNQISSSVDKAEEQMQYNTNEVEQFALNTLESAVDFGTHYMLGMVTGIPSIVSMAAQSGLSKYAQNRREGYDEKTSLGNAILSGSLTMLTEKIGLDNFTKIASSGLGKFSVSALVSQALSEGAEEGIEYTAEPLIDYATLGKYPDYNAGELFMSVGLGMSGGALIGSAGNMISAVKTRKGANQLKADMQLLTDYANKNVLTNDEAFVVDQTLRLGKKALDKFESTSIIGNAVQFESDKVPQRSVEEIKENFYSFLQPQIDAERASYKEKMAVANVIKNAQQTLLNKGINMDVLQYSNLDEDVKKQVDTLQGLARDLKQDVVFDSELNVDGVTIDGYYDNETGRIVINPNGNNPAMSTFVHELTHGTESSKTYKRLKELVMASDKDFDKNVQNTMELYKNVQNLTDEGASQEYIAIYLQEMLGNEDFVKRLVKYDTSLASRIYEGVKKVVFNTKTSQDIEYAFMKAFRDSGISEQEILQYSFKDAKGKDIVLDEQQIQNNSKEILKMDPVAFINENKFAKDDTSLINKITNFFEQQGNTAYNPLIGEVQLDRQGAKSLIAHLPRYVDKYATVEAIPQVINQGKLIRLEENWKNRGKDTCVITAPVEVGESKKYMSVVLEQFTGRDGLTTRYYVHDLVILDNEKATSELHKTHISGTQDVVAYTYNILNNSKNDKYSMGLSSQDLSQRLQGDDYLNALDTIDTLKSVNANVDEKGYVTLYHRTNSESAKKILDSKKMLAKEDGIFFSTSKNGSNNYGYGDSVVTLNVPVEDIEIDDIFDDEASIRIPLYGRNRTLDISKYITDNHFKNKKVQYSIGLTKDNLGRNLSEEQKNYFANTKVKDEDGNIQVMYRGGNEETNVFDNKKSRASNLYGRGFYFTADESHAAQYGQARSYYLNIENPLSLDEHNISKDEIVKLLQAIEDDGEDYDLSNYGYGATPESIANDIYGKSDFDMLQDISATAIGDLVYTTKWFNELNGTNYDGFILPTETVVFDSNQIKNVDNTTPTTSRDIRYSKGLSTEDIKKRGVSKSLKDFIGSFNEKSWLNTKYLSNDVYTYLSDAEQQIKENGNVSDETKARIKDYLWKSFVIEEDNEGAQNVIKDQKAIRKIMKSGSLSIESIGARGKDFTEFRNKNFGNFTFTKNGGRGVDNVYQELAEQYPHYFDESITNPSDQIKVIAEFLNTKHEPKRTVHLGNDGLEVEEFETYFDDRFNKYIRTVTNKEIADDVNSSIKNSHSPEEVKKRALDNLKSKYSDLNPMLVDRAIDEVQKNGYVTETTKGALKDDLMQFFGDDSIFKDNPKAKNRVHDFINETVEHFAAKGQYESDIDFANSVASKANKILKGYAGISNEDIDNLYDEVATIKEADSLLKEKRDLRMLNYTDLVDDMLFKGKDSKGYMSQIERVFDKVADGDVELRTKIRNTLELPRYQAQIQYVNSLNKYNSTIEQIVKTGIREGSKESKAVQWIMEKQREDGSEYTNADLYNEFNYKMKNGKMAYDNIENAAKLLRKDYDDMYQIIEGIRNSIYGDVELKNELDTKELQAKFEIARENLNKIQSAVKKNPTAQNQRVYAASLNEYKLLSRQLSTKLDDNASGDSTRRQDLKYRENYAHRTYEKESVFLKLIKERVGIKEVPTKLAGISDYAQPKTGYASFFKKRFGGSYEADALKGFSEYIQDASRIIAYDPLIEYYRDFTSALQNTAKDDTMSQFTRYLINYTNSLAGKTNPIDRPVRELMGDTLFGVFKEINNKVKANAILGNLKTSVTQLANAPMAASMLVKNGGTKAVQDLTKGSFNYLTSLFNGKGDKSNLSPFIQARFFDTDTDAIGIGAKVDNMFNFLLTKGDEIVTKMLWNSAYEQALRKNVDSPIFYADDLTRRTVAGRGHGEVPVALQSQVLNFVIPFQVETSNTMNNFIDMAKDPKSWGALLVALLGDFFFNELFENLTGSRPLFDPIDVVRDAIKNEEDLGTTSGHMAGEILGAMPGGNLTPTVLGMDSYETKKYFGDNDPSRYGTGNIGLSAIKDIASSVVDGKPLNAASDVVANFVLPGGGKQAQRTIESLQVNGILPQYVNGEWIFSPAYYKSNGKVGYETLPETIFDNSSNLGNFAKQIAFGKWAGNEAQEYLNGASHSGISSKSQKIIDWFTSKDENVSEKDIMAMTEEIEEARDGFTSSNPKGELIEWMDSKNYSNAEKNMIFDTYYGDSKQVTNLNNFSNYYNLSDRENYEVKKIVLTAIGKKSSNKIDTIKNSKALEVRKKLDEIGLYDKYIDYILENDLDLSSMGLNKKVAKMTNEEFENEYGSIFENLNPSKTEKESKNLEYEKAINSSKAKKSNASKSSTISQATKLKNINNIIDKISRSVSTTNDSKVDAILNKMKNNSSTIPTSNSELMKRYLKEHAYDAALFN